MSGGVPHVWGVPHLRSREVPHLGGVPHFGGGSPCPGGYLMSDGGDPISASSIAQSRIASTCYAAGGVPLAFTQEDFLVLFCFVGFFCCSMSSSAK